MEGLAICSADIYVGHFFYCFGTIPGCTEGLREEGYFWLGVEGCCQHAYHYKTSGIWIFC